MAYQVPPRWAHGDQTVSAANMNKYSDSLNYLDATVGSQVAYPATPKVDGESLYFSNRWRWLWYWTTSGSTATISDPSGVGDDVTLADVTEMTVYDLSNVSWIIEGTSYTLTGVDYAQEDYEP